MGKLATAEDAGGRFGGASAAYAAGPIEFLDPVGFDTPSDPILVLTHRELARLLTIATETGGRFERDDVTVDPLAWLYSPRQIFEGQAAVNACQSHSAFVRGVLLHGLSLGLDADPAMLDYLMADDSDDEDLPLKRDRSWPN